MDLPPHLPPPHLPPRILLTLSLLLNCTCTVFTPPQFSLLASAVSWGVVWLGSRRWGSSSSSSLPSSSGAGWAGAGAGAGAGRYSCDRGRFSGISCGGSAAALMLSACVVLAGICERAVSTPSLWSKSYIPATTYLLHALYPPPTNTPSRGLRRVLFLLTVGATFALQPRFVSNSALALGLCSALFSAASLVLLGQIVAEDSDGKGLADRVCGVVREVAMYTFLSFGAASIVFESFPLQVLSDIDAYTDQMELRRHAWLLLGSVVGMGFLGAVRLATVPLIVHRHTAVGAGLLEVAGVLLLSLPTLGSASVLQVLGVLVFVVGISGYITARTGGDREGGSTSLFLRRRGIRLCTLVLLVLGGCLYNFTAQHRPLPAPPAPAAAPISTSEHPIPALIRAAEARYADLQAGQSKSLAEAVAEYRRRYGMSPPPNFDKWYEFAVTHNAVIIDDYDLIHNSLKPFWGLPPAETRKRVREAIGFNDPLGTKDNKLLHVAVRAGATNVGGQGPDWQKKATVAMMDRFVEWLPDMDLPFNIHDEPRVVVPSDMLSQYLQRAQTTLSTLPQNPQPITEFTPPPAADRARIPDFPTTRFSVFAHQPIWSGAVHSCPPDSPAKSIDPETPDASPSFSHPPLGFLSDHHAASDICLSPSLERRHGFFERPNAFNVANTLLPVFSQSKVSSFTDILYPSPWYWANKVPYNPAQDPAWADKNNTLFWRGSTTGGFSRNDGWRNHHRQRAIGLINGNTTAQILTRNPDDRSSWIVTSTPRSTHAHLFDAYFSSIGQCDPSDCLSQSQQFSVRPAVPQHEVFKYKYLLDLDGNAFSGRFYAFLQSQSAVFKQSVFREWHSDWLVPWVHYVPLSMDMEEVVEVLRFFDGEEEGRELVRRIAEEGGRWARKVLRGVDLEVWLFRLLLEYGRVIDDNRETIGYLG